ncbi:hypothetical protein [Paenibacillus sp. GbtcB18]|uniref:hypothetical protein n=1 Tax=Paenibacillus sp. GbtcB18 TaxID=2824763 RepID=UPI001C30DFC1|nr:hypothetical protein [Paenibacillus sp. GbtcB18]
MANDSFRILRCVHHSGSLTLIQITFSPGQNNDEQESTPTPVEQKPEPAPPTPTPEVKATPTPVPPTPEVVVRLVMMGLSFYAYCRGL